MLRSRFAILFVLLFINGVARAAGSGEEVPRLALLPSWDWLVGTYWYVPASDLPAYLYDVETRTNSVAPDQTVFHIAESHG